jgi:hypothetical protein
MTVICSNRIYYEYSNLKMIARHGSFTPEKLSRHPVLGGQPAESGTEDPPGMGYVGLSASAAGLGIGQSEHLVEY